MTFKDERWLSPKETSQVLEVTTERVRQVVKKGQLPYIETPLGRLFRLADVLAYKSRRDAAKVLKESA